MKPLRLILQILGVLLLIPAVALATMRIENSNNDGASIVFPGGELVSGDLYTGPEPDWGFTNDIATIDLQLYDPISSRRVWILESDGRIYVASSYMESFLGRLWKQWAVRADQGEGRAMIRVDGVRYERRLERIERGPELDGVAARMTNKYNSPTTRADIEAGTTWIFELAPPRG